MGLTATKAKNLVFPGRYGAGGGLYLNVSRTGTKSWVQRIVVDGQRKDIGLGGYPNVSLVQARQWTAENRSRVADGKAPMSARERTASTKPAAPKLSTATFEQMARAFHGENTGSRWVCGKNIRNWLQRAEKYLFPSFGDMPIDQITGGDLLDVIVPVQNAKPETGMRLRVICRQVFARAQARGLIGANPAGEAISGGLPPVRKTRTHMAAVHYSDVPGLLQKIDAGPAYLGTKLALRFMALTAARGSEVRNAKWSEVSGNDALWTVPAERMKTGVEHRVPLSRQAVDVLEQARQLSWDSEYIFPSYTGRPLSDNSFGKAFRDLQLGAVPHGLRSSFRNWASEQSGASWETIELSLSHKVGGPVAQAYFRSDLLDQRRPLLQAWGDYVTGSRDLNG